MARAESELAAGLARFARGRLQVLAERLRQVDAAIRPLSADAQAPIFGSAEQVVSWVGSAPADAAQSGLHHPRLGRLVQAVLARSAIGVAGTIGSEAAIAWADGLLLGLRAQPVAPESGA